MYITLNSSVGVYADQSQIYWSLSFKSGNSTANSNMHQSTSTATNPNEKTPLTHTLKYSRLFIYRGQGYIEHASRITCGWLYFVSLDTCEHMGVNTIS